MLGIWESLLIGGAVIIAIIVFSKVIGKKSPEVAKNLGQTAGEVAKGFRETARNFTEGVQETNKDKPKRGKK